MLYHTSNKHACQNSNIDGEILQKMSKLLDLFVFLGTNHLHI